MDSKALQITCCSVKGEVAIAWTNTNVGERTLATMEAVEEVGLWDERKRDASFDYDPEPGENSDSLRLKTVPIPLAAALVLAKWLPRELFLGTRNWRKLHKTCSYRECCRLLYLHGFTRPGKPHQVRRRPIREQT